jgi:hypothetical protein
MQIIRFKFFQILHLVTAISVSASCSKPQNRSKNRPSKSETSSDAKGSESKGLSESDSILGIADALEGDFEDLTYEEAREFLVDKAESFVDKPSDDSKDDSKDDSEDDKLCIGSVFASEKFQYIDGSLQLRIEDADFSSCIGDELNAALSVAFSVSCKEGDDFEKYDGSKFSSFEGSEKCQNSGFLVEMLMRGDGETDDGKLEFTIHNYNGNDSLGGEYRKVYSSDDNILTVKDRRFIWVENSSDEDKKSKYIDLRPAEDIVYDKDKEIFIAGEWEVRLNNWKGTVSFNKNGNLDYEISDGESTKNGSIEVE